MKLYLKLLFISMISFIYAECSEIDNQDDCERFEWCEWIESDNVPNGGVCTGEWEDDEDGEDDEEGDDEEGDDDEEEEEERRLWFKKFAKHFGPDPPPKVEETPSAEPPMIKLKGVDRNKP